MNKKYVTATLDMVTTCLFADKSRLSSRNRFDFLADRLRVAATEPTLLAILNRFSNMAGCSVTDIKPDVLTAVLESAHAGEDKVIAEWLRAQPQIVVAIAKSAKEDRIKLIDGICDGGYTPVKINDGPSALRPRRGFDIGLTVAVTSALSHAADEKAGNATLFRRADVAGGRRLPFYSGNAVGGQIRDLLADHFLETIGLPVSKSVPCVSLWFFHLLYSGGIMAAGAIPKEFESRICGAAVGTIRSDGVRELRDKLPFFSLLGGVAKSPVEGYLYINDLRPVCAEWGTGDIPVRQLMTWRYIARRDDYEGRVSKASASEEDGTADAANTSMLVNTECLAEGTILEGGIDLSRHMTDLEKSCLGLALLLLKKNGYLGGKKHRGYGRVEIEYSGDIPSPDFYEKYLAEKKDDIIKYLIEIGANPVNTAAMIDEPVTGKKSVKKITEPEEKDDMQCTLSF